MRKSVTGHVPLIYRDIANMPAAGYHMPDAFSPLSIPTLLHISFPGYSLKQFDLNAKACGIEGGFGSN